ncbi:MAG: phosphoenolpyruvate carboxykinase (GTP) [Armatimonadetes bacterium]|nr:phosphoenolpyruvate carboxykinase (GTP) [Armatimonadota bacterium]
MVQNDKAAAWVEEMAALCQPDQVVWCDGSDEEKERFYELSLKTGEFQRLDQEKLPGCYYHRSAQNDVARTEHLTFICTPTEREAGPTNNWMAPDAAYEKLRALFNGCMKGRTMYVIPFIMGPPGSPFCEVGIQLTDSLYVVQNMRMMTRMGNVALEQLRTNGKFTECLHSNGELDIDRRYICHFPQDNRIWSFGSGYGGNALLGKKCLSLRIASYLGRKEQWMAEHMLILGVEDPQGNTSYIAAAFPSACGKTNLAMLIPPDSMPGYKVYTVGDDIAWLRVGPDGRLWAINPEAGFFGVLPGTSMKTNPNAMLTMKKNTIFTNVVKADDNTVWWEGMGVDPPAHGTDWKGDEWTPERGEKGAHPNSRFTAPAAQCPVMSSHWEDPQGVPISAIFFGGRRSHLTPLIYETLDWNHGTFVGATMGSETTAAATSASGVLRRDPMAMLPFCGYNMADYFHHWLEMGKRIPHPPKIFNVNWFKKDDEGNYLWPGFGDNLRALEWALKRCRDEVEGTETPIGRLPRAQELNLSGLDLPGDTVEQLLTVDPDAWLEEVEGIEEFFQKFGDDLPQEFRDQAENLKRRLKAQEKIPVS